MGLAVPVVHVVGATRLFQNGILMRDGSALERLAEVDHVVFDKTGTLTMGDANVTSFTRLDGRVRSRIKALAANSSHPASKAIAQMLEDASERGLDSVSEKPGFGVEASIDGTVMRLGRPDWVAEIAAHGEALPDGGRLGFAMSGAKPVWFGLEETMRVGAQDALSSLQRQHVSSEILSGDSAEPVQHIAEQLGIDHVGAGETPASKFARIKQLQAAGHKVLMVGDGINDAPSLAAGHASMAPASASDIGRQAADFVFTRDNLRAVPFAIGIARRAGRLVRGNFALAILYNCIAVPLAMAGYVTPLVAAIAMSASSILVVGNSLRLLTDKGVWGRGGSLPFRKSGQTAIVKVAGARG
jgi:Cu2+-exporting ATPase